MPRFYLDTEFNGFGGELLSLALAPHDVSDDHFYVHVERDYPLVDWVAKNVQPYLNKVPDGFPTVGSILPLTRVDAARALGSYLRKRSSDKEPAIIVADWPEDFAQMMNLFITGPGMMVNVPDFNCEYRALRGFNTADASSMPHNALADAIALRDYCVSL